MVNVSAFAPITSAADRENAAEPYAVTDYTVTDNGNGTATIEKITVKAEDAENVKLYTAVYDEERRLVGLSVMDIENSGENILEPDIDISNSDRVKAFIWRGMEPVADVYELKIPLSEPSATPPSEPSAESTLEPSSIPIVEPSATPAVSGTEFYVAVNGNDETGDGTIDNPYASFEKARSVISGLNGDMTENITVYFRGGTYYLDKTIVLGAEDSGTNGYDVEYKAYPGETPVFSGGKMITGWTQDTENPNLYVAELQRNERLRQLYVNDERAYMPSRRIRGQGGYGTYTITEGEGDYAWTDLTQSDGVKFNPSDLPADIKNPSDIEVQTRSTWTTATVAIRGVENHDGFTVALFEQPYGAMAQNLMWGTNYNPGKDNYVYNIFEFLDEPGEFYFDRAEQKLYYWPREGEDMATAEVYAPEVDTLLRIEGTDLENHANHIVIDGLVFENTDWNLYEIAGSHGKASTQTYLSLTSTMSDWHAVLFRNVDVTAAAVEITSADNIRFINNTLKHTANDGLSIINDVTDSVIDGNVIYDIGGTAVSVGHPQHHLIGDKGSPELFGYSKPSNQMSDKEMYDTDVEGICTRLDITNNYMIHLGRMYYGCPGMTVYYGTELDILYNHIEDAPYSGLSLGWCWGDMVGADLDDTSGSPDNHKGETPNLQNNEIAYNRIINTLTVMSDGGSIYTLGPMQGTSIHDNYLSKVGKNGYHSRGIHIDEGTRYTEIYNNVIEVDTDQAGIDCGRWGANSNTYHEKGYNTVYDNYTTTTLYKTTTNYETGTEISGRNINMSGFWNTADPVSIIRGAGVRDGYLEKVVGDIEDIILPTNYSLSAETGITEIDVPEIEGEIWLAPEGTTEFTESDTVKKASGGKLAIPEVIGDYYIYVIEDGEVSGPSVGYITTSYVSSDETPARTDVIATVLG